MSIKLIIVIIALTVWIPKTTYISCLRYFFLKTKIKIVIVTINKIIVGRYKYRKVPNQVWRKSPKIFIVVGAKNSVNFFIIGADPQIITKSP